MKFKLLFNACLLGCALMFASCSKELEGEELDYVGTWEGDYTILQIHTTGEGSYDYNDGFLTKSSAGRVRLKGNQLKIGIKKFDVDEKPNENSTGWTMTLDGEEFERW